MNSSPPRALFRSTTPKQRSSPECSGNLFPESSRDRYNTSRLKHLLPGILCSLIAVAGWHYLFYSRAAHRLGAIENPTVNQNRIRLRRINGFILLLIAFGMFAGFYTFDSQVRPTAFVVTWFTVMLLFAIMLLLVAIDVWMIMRLRRRKPPEPPST